MDIWKQFEENDLTHSAAHHLLAILKLREEQGYARVTDVARTLNITTGSASTNLKNLKAKGLVEEDPNRFLVLSELGESLAKAVIARRNIFLKFLTEILLVSPEQAEIDACKTEHLLSHETSENLLIFLQIAKKDLNKMTKKLDALLHGSRELHEFCAAQENCQVCGERCLLNEC